jgi:hypothetical protein
MVCVIGVTGVGCCIIVVEVIKLEEVGLSLIIDEVVGIIYCCWFWVFIK